jgi:hypothetical protein
MNSDGSVYSISWFQATEVSAIGQNVELTGMPNNKMKPAQT